MALEATLVFEIEKPIPFTCADATGIEKGSFVYISDPFTVLQSNTDNDPIIGIAAEEKIANDGKVKIGVYLRGIFKATAGAAGWTAGDALIANSSTGDNNEIVSADVNSEHILGMALETATDLQTGLFYLNPFTVNLA